MEAVFGFSAVMVECECKRPGGQSVQSYAIIRYQLFQSIAEDDRKRGTQFFMTEIDDLKYFTSIRSLVIDDI